VASLMTRDLFEELIAARGRGLARGLYSVCSANPLVLEAALRRARNSGLPLLVEATANQVNQEGGYTGQRPRDFAVALESLRERLGLDPSLLAFGGDHLGPYPWRKLPAAKAMESAEELVRAFVEAGARKIHLDASMALGDDQGQPEPRLVAERAARLCAAAEDECAQGSGVGRATSLPIYVIGTEVPVPGGAQGSEEEGPRPTEPASHRETLELHKEAFARQGLEAAWERVAAVVVQPGVEFDVERVWPYRRTAARELLVAASGRTPPFFEAHSTDYQSTAALAELVEDGFAFLKVGPALTLALREALCGLSLIEAELEGLARPRFQETLLTVMRGDEGQWRGYYQEGDDVTLLYALSDRWRYYWERPELQAEFARLLSSLEGRRLPLGLLSQHLPRLGGPQGAASFDVLEGPRGLLLTAIDAELARYEAACFPDKG